MNVGAVREGRTRRRRGGTVCAKALRQERHGVFEALKLLEGLPWWSTGQDSMLPSQGHRFEPWSGN